MPFDTVFEIYVVCSSILVLNLLFLANGTALVRARQKQMLNPEDKQFNAEGEVREVNEGAVARWRRAHLNALENILPFLPMGFLLVMTNPSTTLAGALFGSFTVFRLAHSFFYVKSMQPGRTISFGLSALSLTVMVVVVLVKVLTA